jgi:hypothetical protein
MLKLFGHTIKSIFQGNKANDGGAVYFAAVSNMLVDFTESKTDLAFSSLTTSQQITEEPSSSLRKDSKDVILMPTIS